MKRTHLTIALLALAPIAHSQATASSRKARTKPLSEPEIATLREKIDAIAWRDQQFRRYLSAGTLDEKLLARIAKMGLAERMQFSRKHKSELSSEESKLMRELQRRNDLYNQREFEKIVATYGYPSEKRLGVERDRLFVILLHPPVARAEIGAHVEKMMTLLKPEVLAGNMPPKKFAMFYDNMCGKILRKAQLYGTNKIFNSRTGKVEPPIIGDIGETNRARREIGLPELRKGEYQLAKTKTKNGK